MLVIYWASMYIVNDSYGRCRRCKGLDGYLWCHLFLPAGCVNVLLKVANLDEFLHQVMHTLVLFSGVLVILMVEALSIPVSFSRIRLNWLQPSKV